MVFFLRMKHNVLLLHISFYTLPKQNKKKKKPNLKKKKSKIRNTELDA